MDRRDLQMTLVQDLLAAPGTPDGWQVFLNHLCGALDGSAASFISMDLVSGRGGISITARTDPEALRAYQEHWYRLDPWAHSPRLKAFGSGHAVVGEQLVEARQLAQSAFYNDFGRRYDIVRCLAGMVEASNAAFTCVSINGAEAREPFGTEDAALVQSLVGPIQQAMRLHRRLAMADASCQASGDLLDRLPVGVIVLASNGRPTQVNAAAQRVLRRRDGLSIERQTLQAASPALTRALQSLIHEAEECARGFGVKNGGAVRLTRPSGKRDLLVVVSGVGRAWDLDLPAPEATAIVFVTDVDDTAEPSLPALRSLFDFTPTEATIALRLSTGDRVEDIADDLTMAKNTVRWHVKHVLAKAGVRTQAQLVRLVLSSPASMNPSN